MAADHHASCILCIHGIDSLTDSIDAWTICSLHVTPPPRIAPNHLGHAPTKRRDLKLHSGLLQMLQRKHQLSKSLGIPAQTRPVQLEEVLCSLLR